MGPQNRGVEQFTFYSPDLHRYLSYIDPLVDTSLVVGGVSIVFIVLGWVLMKYFPGLSKRIGILLVALGLFGVSFIFLAFTIQNFLLGEVEEHSVVYKAINEPAKFNTVLLMYFILADFLLFLSAAVIVGIISKRIKPLDDW